MNLLDVIFAFQITGKVICLVALFEKFPNLERDR